MATQARPEEADSLLDLEERIHKAVQLVAQLRQERDVALRRADELAAANAASDQTIAELQDQNTRLAGELNLLQSERKQVRTRIEKLLGQMDVLGAT